MNNEISTKLIGDARLIDPFKLITNKMFSIFDEKGILPSVFENISTSYPYDHYMGIDKKSGKVVRHVFKIPVAGYKESEILVQAKPDTLKIMLTPGEETSKKDPDDDYIKKYIHHGVKAGRVKFEWFIKGLKPDNVKKVIKDGMLIITVYEIDASDGYIDI